MAELLRVVYSTCQARGYHLLIGHVERNKTERRVLSDILSVDRVDGVLVIGDFLGRRAGAWIGSSDPCARCYGETRPSLAGELSILVDDVRAVTLALEHLAALGHRSIGHLRRDPPSGPLCHGKISASNGVSRFPERR
jgi:DNA-binding LacI/PurR family transcriptional regulator